MPNNDNLKDHGLERALIGTIIKNGKDSLIDCLDILDFTDFSLPINQKLFRCLKDMSEDVVDSLDIESIKLKSKKFQYDEFFDTPTAREYLELICSSSFEPSRVREFAFQVKKLSIARDLLEKASETVEYISGITGNEKLSEIIGNAEQIITNYVNGVNIDTSLQQIGECLLDRINRLVENEPVTQIGLPTGFNIFDRAIGGGLRRATVNVIGARPKRGKSVLALNMSTNIAELGIPVLYLDSEMTITDAQNRLVCINSGCPMYELETGKFGKNKTLKEKVVKTVSKIQQIPFHYESIVGKSTAEILSIMRRWIVKHVGFNEEGKANDCAIFYDYIKLTSSEGLSGHTPEYMLIGFALTALHTFAVQYGVPLVTFVQLNRDGINVEDTSVVAQSDRILWLCSSLSFLKDKDDTDDQLGCGHKFGNKKIVVMETRHGPGLNDDDYINLFAQMRPGVANAEATFKMKEGYLFSQVKTLGDPGADISDIE